MTSSDGVPGSPISEKKLRKDGNSGNSCMFLYDVAQLTFYLCNRPRVFIFESPDYELSNVNPVGRTLQLALNRQRVSQAVIDMGVTRDAFFDASN